MHFFNCYFFERYPVTIKVNEDHMAKSLIIVESPTKVKTISKYVGKDFKVLATVGHIKDLPDCELVVHIFPILSEYVLPLSTEEQGMLIARVDVVPPVHTTTSK